MMTHGISGRHGMTVFGLVAIGAMLGGARQRRRQRLPPRKLTASAPVAGELQSRRGQVARLRPRRARKCVLHQYGVRHPHSGRQVWVHSQPAGCKPVRPVGPDAGRQRGRRPESPPRF